MLALRAVHGGSPEPNWIHRNFQFRAAALKESNERFSLSLSAGVDRENNQEENRKAIGKAAAQKVSEININIKVFSNFRQRSDLVG